jgi:hypothetical protein
VPRRFSAPNRSLFYKITARSKAVSPLPLCHRTPKRFALALAAVERASVLECGSPVPLFDACAQTSISPRHFRFHSPNFAVLLIWNSHGV